ncbi:aminoglycoside phosphotransferase family protein [Streptomyces sp. NBC_00704]|uniref:phosphotransferase enzyme family protein n=1 Tax=Streptomyces sp. NBC_00704 TaxID=2975809 RepID=UPI002E30C7EA|nr:aminoglycoside phosphotransferase family protein [Streptomyces sp. NBC_00704]
MRAAEAVRAVAAARSIAVSLGLAADDVTVLHDSNKITVRLLPCDVVARVAPAGHQVARFEVDLARRLAASGCPVARLDPRVEPRVHERDGFVVTLWTFHAPVPPYEVPPRDYARALERLHAGMRRVDIPVPHFTARVEQARRLVADHDRTPELGGPDRALLAEALRDLGRLVAGHGGGEQLLHGEPHPGNLLATARGPLFIDFETCCRGPVEFDVAHAPEAVGRHCEGIDADVLRACRLLVTAMVTAWRWDRDDRFPGGRRMGVEGLGRIRSALGRGGFDLRG